MISRLAASAGLAPLNASLYPAAAEDAVAVALIAAAAIAVSRIVRAAPSVAEDARAGLLLGATVVAVHRFAMPLLVPAPAASASTTATTASETRAVAAEVAASGGAPVVLPRDNAASAGVRTGAGACEAGGRGRRAPRFLFAAG